MKEVLRAATMAFCLSIQSIWERQIRSYLVACVRELGGSASKLKAAMMGEWEKSFENLRRVKPSTFGCYPELHTMEELANV
jgi:hypothetical protein